MKKLMILSLVLLLLISAASARLNTDCTFAGYNIVDVCDMSEGNIVMDYSTAIDIQPVRLDLGEDGQIFETFMRPIETGICCQYNLAPSITSTPSTSADFGEMYQYQVTANDPNAQSLSYSLTQAPSSMTINPSTGLISWTVDEVNSASVTIDISDGWLTDSQSFTISISGTECESTGYDCTSTCDSGLGDITHSLLCSGNDVCCEVNDVPVFTSSPVLTATYGELYEYDVDATDNDSLTYLLTAHPSSMSINPSTGLISWIVDGVTSTVVQVEATDGYYSPRQLYTIHIIGTECEYEGYTCQASCNLAQGDEQLSLLCTSGDVCCDVNDAPVITTNAILNTNYGDNYQYDVDANDPNNDVLTFILRNNPVSMSINSLSGLITWAVDEMVSVFVEVEVNDGYLSDTQNYTLSVAGTDCEYYENTCTATCSALSGDIELPQFTCLNSEVCCIPNTAPNISSVGPNTVQFQGIYIYQVSASDSDNDSLNFSLLSKPSTMTIDNNGLISWTVDQAGWAAFTVEVSDGYLTDTETVNITISGSECENNNYTCKLISIAHPGDIMQAFDCGPSAACYEDYVPFTQTIPESFWSIEFTRTLIMDRDWDGDYPNEGEHNYSNVTVYDEIVQGDMNYWILNKYENLSQGELREFYTQDEYLVEGNHPVTITIIDKDPTEIDCSIHRWTGDYTYSYNVSTLYLKSSPAHDASYTYSTWIDDQASCTLNITDGITSEIVNITFNKTNASKIEYFLDPVYGGFDNGGYYSHIDPTMQYYTYAANNKALPRDFTVVHGNFSIGLNVTGRMADRVQWTYVWFYYYGFIPPEVPTAGYELGGYNESSTKCGQAQIDDGNWSECNYWHHVLMENTYINNSFDKNKIFAGIYDSTLPQWNDNDVMWRYYAKVYDRDIHYTDRTYIWNIIFDNTPPAAPQNFAWETYPSQSYPGRIDIDFLHPGDNGMKTQLSNVYNHCDDNYGNNIMGQQEIDECGWYEFKYRNFEDGPVTDENWNDPETILYQPSLSWMPALNNTYQHTWIDLYPQFVPDHWRYKYVTFPESRKQYYVGLKAFDGEGQASPLVVPDARDLVIGAENYSLPQGAVLSGWNMIGNVQLVSLINETGYNRTIQCTRDRDAGKYDDCQSYKDDGTPTYPPAPNWIRRTMYLYDNLTLSAKICNFGNINQTKPVYLRSYGTGGTILEQQTEVFLPWANPEKPEIAENELNCADIVFHEPISRESLYMYYEIYTSSTPGDSNGVDNYASMNWDQDVNYNFHSWSTESVAHYLWYEYKEEVEFEGRLVNVTRYAYRFPVVQALLAFNPYTTGSDNYFRWELDNAYDYRFPMWDFPITYNIRYNGTDEIANDTHIYYRTTNGMGWNYNDNIIYHDQKDEFGYRNSFIEFVNISQPIFQNVTEHSTSTDWPLVHNDYIFNNSIGYYQYVGHNETHDFGDYELHWEPSYPWLQTRWFHTGVDAKDLNISVTYGFGQDAKTLGMKWLYASSGIPDPEVDPETGAALSYYSEYRDFVNLTKGMQISIHEAPNMLPIVSPNTGCWVDVNPDTYTYATMDPYKNVDDLLTDQYVEWFMTTSSYHTVGNSDAYWDRTWDWTPIWESCDTATMTTESIVKITTDITNPSPVGPTTGAGRSVVSAPSLYSYVNGVENLEDLSRLINYIQPNSTLNKTAAFYFRPDRVGTTTFEAWLDWYNDELDESVELFTYNVQAPGSKSTFTQDKAAKPIKVPKNQLSELNVKVLLPLVSTKQVVTAVETFKNFNIPEPTLPEGYEPKTADPDEMIQAQLEAENLAQSVKLQRLQEQKELDAIYAQMTDSVLVLETSEEKTGVEESQESIPQGPVSSKLIVGGIN